jgi:hypothetical protein
MVSDHRGNTVDNYNLYHQTAKQESAGLKHQSFYCKMIVLSCFTDPMMMKTFGAALKAAPNATNQN